MSEPNFTDKKEEVIQQMLAAWDATCRITGPAAESKAVCHLRDFLAGMLQTALSKKAFDAGIRHF